MKKTTIYNLWYGISKHYSNHGKSHRSYLKAIFLLIVGIATGIFIGGAVLKEMRSDEQTAWDREESFYNKIRKKNLSRLSVLSRKLGDLDKEKIGIEKRLDALVSEKGALEKEKKELLKRLEGLRVQTEEAIARKEQEVKARSAKKHENEIAALKKRVAESEKNKKEEMKEVDEKNRELQNNFRKVNQSNEHLIKKIEDLKKVRNELEEELRRRRLE